jgi:2-polyprenyl-3-methyl-5-hydroxy-6-metoxy-1,4-benzoquinol methylase
VGNKILTRIQNRLLHSNLSEFHSGYRLYSVEALKKLPLERNTNDFHFDTEIIIQLLRAQMRIRELPIPTYYGDEICHVNGMKYAWDVVKSTLLSRAQDLGIFYQRNFDVSAGGMNLLYQSKWGFESPHTLALARVKPGSKVVDVGCASGYMARALKDKNCEVTGIDEYPPFADSGLKEFVQGDLDNCGFPLDAGAFQYILLLDVIEHLRSPEAFADALRASRRQSEDTRVIVSTGNVAFLVTRLMLLLGFFNYGSRGILDLTHTRLFTFATVRNLFEQSGYRIEEVRGVPAPFPVALGNTALARFLVRVNHALIRISRSLFAYQIFMVVRPLPSLEWLLQQAVETSDTMAQERAAG